MKKLKITLAALLILCFTFGTALAIPPMPPSPAGGLTNVTDCGKYANLQACVDAAGSYGYAWAPGTYTAGIALTNAHAGLTLDFGGSGYIHVVTGSAITVTGTSDTVRANHITIKDGRVLTDSTTALNDGSVTANYYSTSAYTKSYYWNCKTEIGTWASN